EPEKLGLELIACSNVDGLNFVGKVKFLEQHRDLVTVGRGPVVKLDHESLRSYGRRSRRGGLVGEDRNDITRVGAIAIIDVRAGVDDGAVTVDDVGRGDGERPFARRSVKGRNIAVESLVGAAQFVGKLID